MKTINDLKTITISKDAETLEYVVYDRLNPKSEKTFKNLDDAMKYFEALKAGEL